MKKFYLFLLSFSFYLVSYTQTLFSENFDVSTFPPSGWTFLNVSSAGSGWVDNKDAILAFGPYASFSGTGCMVYEYDPAIQADSWAITPDIALTAGVGVAINFYYKVEDGFYPEKMKVTVGNGITVADQTTILWDNNGGTELINTTWQKASVLFVPSTTGNYNFGFNCYSDPDEFALSVDDISVEVAPTSLPSCASLLTPSNNAIGVSTQQTDFSWNAAFGASGYTFYLGTNPTPDSVGVTQDTTISFTGLAYSTFYYWSVSPSNVLGTTTGCNVYSFTTEDPPPPPANDDCSGAITLQNSIPTSGTTLGATESQPADACNGFTGDANDDVWYSFTTDQAGDVTITVDPDVNFDAVLIAYSGTCGSFSLSGCADSGFEGDQEVYTFTNLGANETYYIRVYEYNGAGTEGTFTINASGTAFALPVTLLRFTGQRKGNMDVLNWITSTEINNKGFEVQRSIIDGNNFSSLAFVPTKSLEGNSVKKISYIFENEKAFKGNEFYRLKQIDRDGKFKYSPIVFIQGNKMEHLVLNSFYPNPAINKLNLSIFSPVGQSAFVLLSDIAGRNIKSCKISFLQGQNNIILTVSSLMKGIYFLKITATSGENVMSKFVKE